jgi:hypothetical protein
MQEINGNARSVGVFTPPPGVVIYTEFYVQRQ